MRQQGPELIKKFREGQLQSIYGRRSVGRVKPAKEEDVVLKEVSDSESGSELSEKSESEEKEIDVAKMVANSST